MFGAELVDGLLVDPDRRLRRVHAALPRIARDAGVRLFEVAPTDDSLESVFSYLVRR